MADVLRTKSDEARAIGLCPPTTDSDQYFRKVLDELPAAVYTTDALGRITYFNDAAAALWGYRPELGRSEWCGSWKLFWPDGRSLPHGECPMALAIRDKRANRGMEAIAERPDGTRVPFIPYPTPLFDTDGILTGAVNMLVDITERKRGEETVQRLAAIVESSDDAILTKTLDGVIQTWNKGAERIFGYNAQEIIGQSVLVLIPEDRRDEEPSILSRIRRGERIDHFETVRVKKDGTLLDISLTVSPVRSLDGTIVGASKVARDISDLRRSRRQSELVLREMDHRVKNSFALASGIVAIAARTAATPKDLAHTVAERLGALARAHALTITTSHGAPAQSATLRALLDAIMSPFEGKTDTGNARISLECIDIPISGEAVASLALLLHEFATNAAKYGALSMPSGRVNVTVSESESMINLDWKERGGPPIEGKVVHEGFGTVLAQMTVEGQLGGKLSRDWQQDGLRIQLSVRHDRLQR